MALELQHLIIKFPVDGPLGLAPARVVDLFHKWVAAQSAPGFLLIDVAELLHVPEGPGVIAVGHEADFALDNNRGVWGVLYRRKTVLPGPMPSGFPRPSGRRGGRLSRSRRRFPAQSSSAEPASS